jgi:hypothetical protein
MEQLQQQLDIWYKLTNFPMPVCDKGMWLIAYDLRSSRASNISENDRAWVESQRVKIWLELRHKYKCSPIQQSLWLVRDKQTMEQLQQQLDIWRKLYEARGYPVRLAMLPLQTDADGFRTFMEMELDFLLQWLTSVVKGLDKNIKSGKVVQKKQLRLFETKVYLLQEILDEDFGKHSRYGEIKGVIGIALDKLNDVKKLTPINT